MPPGTQGAGAQANQNASVDTTSTSMERRPLPSSRPETVPETEQLVVESSSEDDEASSDDPPLPTSMSKEEAAWWAMSFEELLQHARSKRHGNPDAPRRKSGRTKIIKWLCEIEGIKPFSAAPLRNSPDEESTPVVESAPVTTESGAIAHPEAVLRTTDPELLIQIEAAEANYKTWTAVALLDLAMKRSYQLLKDSSGKLPSKSIATLSRWLASWDVLKSEREKKMWLGDGIDLVNKARAIGYKGGSKKYEVILWMRGVPEDLDLEIQNVAEPTNNKMAREGKRKASGDENRMKSKRPAKGSTRPGGWQATGSNLK